MELDMRAVVEEGLEAFLGFEDGGIGYGIGEEVEIGLPGMEFGFGTSGAEGAVEGFLLSDPDAAHGDVLFPNADLSAGIDKAAAQYVDSDDNNNNSTNGSGVDPETSYSHHNPSISPSTTLTPFTPQLSRLISNPTSPSLDHYTLAHWRACAAEIASFPLQLVRSGCTPFIHSAMYSGGTAIPAQLRRAYSVCCAAVAKTEASESWFFEVLIAAVEGLVKEGREREKDGEMEVVMEREVEERLAAVQALVLCQVVGLWDGDVRLRSEAEGRLGLLGEWTEGLQRALEAWQMWSWQRRRGGGERGLQFRRGVTQRWHDWLLAESVRRTVLVSYLIRGVYSMLRFGRCDFIGTLVKLPVAESKLWCRSSGTLWRNEGSALRSEFQMEGMESEMATELVSYEEYVSHWDQGLVHKVGDWGRLLIMVCKGKEAVKGFGDVALPLVR
ncbi:hypothetical protein K490DRAFT_63353 [Saccharata proteae CBS 121410]|uniref:Transcription factor domain-containing protein n=1 Tax=Saccharata proteae CBS 121410 TaxID=1314787 RepID=A0A6A5YBH2_9PEZI|nr:hypothetical protein K490DRAFT_63353 [Saccharata proteae CBS 121410]